ncbi:MAG TPA: hypothetical protein VK849_12395 [Longimicrobiales bacterium]|nr:hypothetical protein [Longimicrobiales bacterium]
MTLAALRSPSRHFLLGLALLVAGCDGDNLIGPDNALEVNNATDSFQWQVSALSSVTQTLTYAWENTGTTANVNQSASLTAGSAMLRVTDAQGVEVYARSLGENGTFQTSEGSAGSWTVTVKLSEANGTFNFRLQKP